MAWLIELRDDLDALPRTAQPKPYYSQRQPVVGRRDTSLVAVARETSKFVRSLHDQHYFAETLGFDCVDRDGYVDTSPEQELERRVGKPYLWEAPPADWSEADVCDFIEVFHDLTSRPTRGRYHSFNNCGWHPTSFSRKSGQLLYRRWVNELLDETSFGLRLAEDGEDIGRMVNVAPPELHDLVSTMLRGPSDSLDEVAHAIALFRGRAATRTEQRSAIFALARVLEQRRALLRQELFSKDEGALFEIANKFDLRHSNAVQRTDYADEYLEWIFYWYLATVRLTDRLIGNSAQPPPA